MTEPHRDSTAPCTAPTNTARGDIDIDLDSSPTAPDQGAADEPALTTSKDAQRDDLLVQPDNS